MTADTRLPATAQPDPNVVHLAAWREDHETHVLRAPCASHPNSFSSPCDSVLLMRGEQPKQSRHEFLAVLIDTASKKPVPAARVILAPKKEGKPECTIDTSLTGVSNDRGEVRISGVQPGEYVVFYNLSRSLNPGLQGKVVNYDPADYPGPGQGQGPAQMRAIDRSLGSHGLVVFEGTMAIEPEKPGSNAGNLVINGYSCSSEWDLVIIQRRASEDPLT